MRYLVAVVLLVLLSGSGDAQTYNNEIGLYTDMTADPAFNSVTPVPNVPFDVYLIVSSPVNEEYCNSGPRAITGIAGFSFRMEIVPQSGMYILAAIPNGLVLSMNVFGSDYFVNLDLFGEAPPISVPSGGHAVLMTFTFLTVDTVPRGIYISIPVLRPSINELVIYDWAEFWDCPNLGNDQFVYPVSGDFANPVFGINTQVVPNESESLGSVKALYR